MYLAETGHSLTKRAEVGILCAHLRWMITPDLLYFMSCSGQTQLRKINSLLKAIFAKVVRSIIEWRGLRVGGPPPDPWGLELSLFRGIWNHQVTAILLLPWSLNWNTIIPPTEPHRHPYTSQTVGAVLNLFRQLELSFWNTCQHFCCSLAHNSLDFSKYKIRKSSTRSTPHGGECFQQAKLQTRSWKATSVTLHLSPVVQTVWDLMQPQSCITFKPIERVHKQMPNVKLVNVCTMSANGRSDWFGVWGVSKNDSSSKW